MTLLDAGTATVVDHALADDPLLSLDALADAAGRLPAKNITHCVADRPRLCPERDAVTLEGSPPELLRRVGSNGCWVMLGGLTDLPEYVDLLRRAAGQFERGMGDRQLRTDVVPPLPGPRPTGAVLARGARPMGGTVHSDLEAHGG